MFYRDLQKRGANPGYVLPVRQYFGHDLHKSGVWKERTGSVACTVFRSVPCEFIFRGQVTNNVVRKHPETVYEIKANNSQYIEITARSTSKRYKIL